MTFRIIITIFLFVTVNVHASEDAPAIPTIAQVAKILGVEESRVSTNGGHIKLKEKVYWLAYYNVTGEVTCSLQITLYRKGQMPTFYFEKNGKAQNNSKKVHKDNGDVIYHAFGERGKKEVFYLTALINFEGDWDMLLILSREYAADESVLDESKLPFVVRKDGIKLIQKIESYLRKQKAQQVVAPDS